MEINPGLGRFVQQLIASAEPIGLWSFVSAAVALAIATAVAVGTATERIVRMDPSAALRIE